jgi:hypothetical protein
VDVIAQLGVSPERAQNRNAVGVKAGSTVGGVEYLQRERDGRTRVSVSSYL